MSSAVRALVELVDELADAATAPVTIGPENVEPGPHRAIHTFDLFHGGLEVRQMLFKAMGCE
ncbi:hypothetical protein GCM10009691_20530 [Brevibacterium picturae]|uniref:Uncharacterized protein n=1 Tax=Brevibacterium picturae TaxID=260553 RepID=A0ABN2BTP0_9MICO